MDKIDKTKDQLEKQAVRLLTGKPIWIWWISYTVLVGILFGLFYFALILLTEKWWAIAIIIIVVGIVLATIAYFNQKPQSEIPPSDE